MTPRFVTVVAALGLALLAWMRPEKMGEALARGYVIVMGGAAPGWINTVVHVMPFVLGGLAAAVVFFDLILYTRESYKNFRDDRKIREMKSFREGKDLTREHQKYLEYLADHRADRRVE